MTSSAIKLTFLGVENYPGTESGYIKGFRVHIYTIDKRVCEIIRVPSNDSPIILPLDVPSCIVLYAETTVDGLPGNDIQDALKSKVIHDVSIGSNVLLPERLSEWHADITGNGNERYLPLSDLALLSHTFSHSSEAAASMKERPLLGQPRLRIRIERAIVSLDQKEYRRRELPPFPTEERYKKMVQGEMQRLCNFNREYINASFPGYYKATGQKTPRFALVSAPSSDGPLTPEDPSVYGTHMTIVTAAAGYMPMPLFFCHNDASADGDVEDTFRALVGQAAVRAGFGTDESVAKQRFIKAANSLVLSRRHGDALDVRHLQALDVLATMVTDYALHGRYRGDFSLAVPRDGNPSSQTREIVRLERPSHDGATQAGSSIDCEDAAVTTWIVLRAVLRGRKDVPLNGFHTEAAAKCTAWKRIMDSPSKDLLIAGSWHCPALVALQLLMGLYAPVAVLGTASNGNPSGSSSAHGKSAVHQYVVLLPQEHAIRLWKSHDKIMEPSQGLPSLLLESVDFSSPFVRAASSFMEPDLVATKNVLEWELTSRVWKSLFNDVPDEILRPRDMHTQRIFKDGIPEEAESDAFYKTVLHVTSDYVADLLAPRKFPRWEKTNEAISHYESMTLAVVDSKTGMWGIPHATLFPGPRDTIEARGVCVTARVPREIARELYTHALECVVPFLPPINLGGSPFLPRVCGSKEEFLGYWGESMNGLSPIHVLAGLFKPQEEEESHVVEPIKHIVFMAKNKEELYEIVNESLDDLLRLSLNIDHAVISPVGSVMRFSDIRLVLGVHRPAQKRYPPPSM